MEDGVRAALVGGTKANSAVFRDFNPTVGVPGVPAVRTGPYIMQVPGSTYQEADATEDAMAPAALLLFPIG